MNTAPMTAFFFVSALLRCAPLQRRRCARRGIARPVRLIAVPFRARPWECPKYSAFPQ